MAAYGPLEAMMANAAIDNNDGKDGADDVIDDDYTPPRDAFHTNPQLCKELIARLGSSVPLEIRSSSICTGSGLFAASANEIEAGREIYSVTLQLAAIDADETSFCHWCFTDAKAGFSRPSDSEDHGDGTVKTCTGCKTARFCSKVCTGSFS
jgi:SET and MYND domain-containing protein